MTQATQSDTSGSALPSGIDFSQFTNWARVVAPNGAVYYRVPDSGYLYSPFLSGIKGKPVIFADPKLAVEEKAKKDALVQEQIDMAKQAASPAGQLMPVVGGVAGTVGGAYLINKLVSNPVQDALAQSIQANTAAQTTGQLAAQAQPVAAMVPTTAPIATTPAQAFAATATPTPIGTAANGGVLMSDGSIAAGAPAEAAALGYAPYLGLAGAGLGAYGLYQGIKEGSKGQSALGGAGLGAGLAAAAPLAGFGPVGWAGLGLAALGGGLGGLGLASALGDKDMWKTEGDRLRKLQEGGAYVPEDLIASTPTKGRSKDELVELAKQTGGNVTFAQSRKESDLTPQDIIGYATFAENDPNWFNKPLQERLALAGQALNAGAVREHHGTIDVDWKKLNAAPEINNTIAPGLEPVAAEMSRSSTSSPGIDKQGNRIDYNRMGQQLAKRMNKRR